jgi:pyruvate/oxaloacetate carboxyltransferase
VAFAPATFANAVAAIGAGATVLDASLGGTGGCPFAPRATGNIATEDLVYLLHGMGHETGIDLDALLGHAAWLSEKLPGQLSKAGRSHRSSADPLYAVYVAHGARSPSSPRRGRGP